MNLFGKYFGTFPLSKLYRKLCIFKWFVSLVPTTSEGGPKGTYTASKVFVLYGFEFRILGMRVIGAITNI